MVYYKEEIEQVELLGNLLLQLASDRNLQLNF